MRANKVGKVSELKRNNLPASCHNKTLTADNAANMFAVYSAGINKLSKYFNLSAHRSTFY